MSTDSSSSSVIQIPKGLKLLQYSDKSFLVVGETKNYREQLKELKGKFTTDLSNYDGCAWLFTLQRLDSVKNYLRTGSVDPPELLYTAPKVDNCGLDEIEI